MAYAGVATVDVEGHDWIVEIVPSLEKMCVSEVLRHLALREQDFDELCSRVSLRAWEIWGRHGEVTTRMRHGGWQRCLVRQVAIELVEFNQWHGAVDIDMHTIAAAERDRSRILRRVERVLHLAQRATSSWELRTLRAWMEHGSVRKAAESMGTGRRSFRRTVSAACKKIQRASEPKK